MPRHYIWGINRGNENDAILFVQHIHGLFAGLCSKKGKTGAAVVKADNDAWVRFCHSVFFWLLSVLTSTLCLIVPA
ncbi:MAG: hypothetical protein HOP36_02075 [Methyloglobulus sp.]|nr:hypothetical protein [Methyloglobulus sp.]